MTLSWTRVKLLVVRGFRKFARLLGLEWGNQSSKSTLELYFQSGWVPLFAQHTERVREYWQRYRYLDDILAIAPTRGKRVLDVGCGISTVLHFIEGERYGVDPLADEYRRIYAYPEGILIAKACGERLPFEGGYFDVVFCTNALDHATDPCRTLSEIRRVLRRGGHFILTVETFARPIRRDAGHPHSLTSDDVHALLRGGFEVVFERYSPWIGLENYVRNRPNSARTNEMIVIARRLTDPGFGDGSPHAAS